ncbi:MAG: hypothetical protein ABJM02_04675 [Paracoccaceae bacterium]
MDDVATGVRITFDDDTYSIITRDSAGAVVDVYRAVPITAE